MRNKFNKKSKVVKTTLCTAFAAMAVCVSSASDLQARQIEYSERVAKERKQLIEKSVYKKMYGDQKNPELTFKEWQQTWHKCEHLSGDLSAQVDCEVDAQYAIKARKARIKKQNSRSALDRWADSLKGVFSSSQKKNNQKITKKTNKKEDNTNGWGVLAAGMVGMVALGKGINKL